MSVDPICSDASGPFETGPFETGPFETGPFETGPSESATSPETVNPLPLLTEAGQVEHQVSELLPAELVFLPDHEPGPASHAGAAPGPIGPGFWESVGWMIGVHFIQVGIAVGTLFALAVLYFANHDLPTGKDAGNLSISDLAHGMMPFLERNLVVVLGLAGFATVLYGAGVVSFRFRRQGGLRGLGWRLPSPGHLALIMMATLPLSLLCTELQKSMFSLVPHAESDLDQIFKRLAEAPLGVILLAIAVAPAFGEELIFRGLIGRGLIARMGIVRGMLLTSVLFGVMHINPAQSVAVIPLGLAMHFVYLATRSFWAPVFVHLLNNSLAAVLMKYEAQIPLAKFLDGDGAMPLHLLTVSAAMVTAIGLLFWQTRVQYASADGTPVDSWWPVSGLPTDGMPVEIRPTPQPLLLACGAFNSLGFLAVLWRQAFAF